MPYLVSVMLSWVPLRHGAAIIGPLQQYNLNEKETDVAENFRVHVYPVTTNLASWQLLVFSGCVYSDVNALVRNQYSTQVIHLIQIRFAIHHILEHPSIMSSISYEEFRRKILPWFSVFLHQCAHVYNMWNFLSNCTSLKRHSISITINISLQFYELSGITKTKPLVKYIDFVGRGIWLTDNTTEKYWIRLFKHLVY